MDYVRAFPVSDREKQELFESLAPRYGFNSPAHVKNAIAKIDKDQSLLPVEVRHNADAVKYKEFFKTVASFLEQVDEIERQIEGLRELDDDGDPATGTVKVAVLNDTEIPKKRLRGNEFDFKGESLTIDLGAPLAADEVLYIHLDVEFCLCDD